MTAQLFAQARKDTKQAGRFRLEPGPWRFSAFFFGGRNESVTPVSLRLLRNNIQRWASYTFPIFATVISVGEGVEVEAQASGFFYLAKALDRASLSTGGGHDMLLSGGVGRHGNIVVGPR